MDISKLSGEKIRDKNLKGVDNSDATKKQENLEQLAGAKQNITQNVKWTENADLLSEGVRSVKNSPDVRKDKVAALKAQIQSGQYKVDADKVADKMLQESLENEILSRK
jgi:negative regulator of flagellin synthesis FlgM